MVVIHMAFHKSSCKIHMVSNFCLHGNLDRLTLSSPPHAAINMFQHMKTKPELCNILKLCDQLLVLGSIPAYSGVGGGTVIGCELGDVSRVVESPMKGEAP